MSHMRRHGSQVAGRLFKDLLVVFFNAMAEACDRIAIAFEEPEPEAEPEDPAPPSASNGRRIGITLHNESEEHHET